ncbi:MAG: muts domain V-domain-containing protein [Monoraphidium minutum]|nr:MAG: muts domain V-domain-containing protein [Monoraphidium minutum]
MLLVEVGYKMRFFGEDAEAAARVLGLHAYPDHSFLTASIPVPRLPVHVRRLVQAGFKVGVCRQTETAALKAASSNRSAPFERRLTALYTASTLDAGERADKIGEEGAMAESQGLDALMPRAGGGSYLMVVAEAEAGGGGEEGRAAPAGGGQGGAPPPAEQEAGAHAPPPRVGVVAVDAASGDVVWGLTSSGLVQSGLEAALLSLAPSEVIALEPLSADTARLLDRFAGQAPQGGGGGSGGGGVRVSRLVRLPGAGYLRGAAASRLVDFYGAEGEGGDGQGTPGGEGGEGGAGAAPEAAPSGVGRGAAAPPGALEFVLSLPPPVLAALAAAEEYLGQFGLAGALLDTGSFRPLASAQGLALSSNALQQLELLRTGEGGYAGSLLHLLDRTATGFGSRLLRRWVACPLAERGLIQQRLDAVEELLAASSPALASLPAELRRLPDLERSFMRCAHGTASPSEAVVALQALQQLPERLGIRLTATPGSSTAQPAGGAAAEAALAAAAAAPLLRRLLAEALSPAATGAAAASLAVLSEGAARSNDFLSLFASRGRFPEVFERAEAVAAAAAHLQGLLPQLARAAGVPASRMRYVSIQNQGDYLVELPADRDSVPTGWEKVCSTKKVSRYHPPTVRAGMARLAVAEEKHRMACRAAWASFLAEFGRRHHPACRTAVSALAHLDALCALAAVAGSPGYTRPRFVEDGEAPRLVVVGGRHPALDLALRGGAVPNDVDLRWDGRRGAIVTGPNMGGKSVYLRMAAVLAVMAHVGSYVPAEACELGVMDGLLTRMGAADDLSSGRSTFAEEMANAAEMLARATPRSLVILDELGRGTATRDGIAVAAATLEHLLTQRQCLTLFTSHYPEVWRGLQQDAGAEGAGCGDGSGGGNAGPGQGGGLSPEAARAVGVFHMAYTTARGGGAGTRGEGGGPGAAAAAGVAAAGGIIRECGPGGDQPPLIFLYTLQPGGADRSFGLNVARMAGLPPLVVSRAADVAASMQQQPAAGGAGDDLAWQEVARLVISRLRHCAAAGQGGSDECEEGGGDGVGGGGEGWVERLQDAARRALQQEA